MFRSQRSWIRSERCMMHCRITPTGSWKWIWGRPWMRFVGKARRRMGLDKNKSAMTHITVTFREIDRFYDVHGRNNPKVASRIPVINGSGEPELLVRDFDDLIYDENGDQLPAGKYYEMQGVYRTIRTYGEEFFTRTFARYKSRQIKGKYVYVWAADDKTGSGMRLVNELFFKDGKFKLIDFKSKARKPKGTSRDSLVLDLLGFKDAK